MKVERLCRWISIWSARSSADFFILASTRVESVGMWLTRGNADRVNLRPLREAQAGTATVDRKQKCRTVDRFCYGGIFYCNSGSSKSTEAFGNFLAEGQGSNVTNNAELYGLRMFKIELPDCAECRGACVYCRHELLTGLLIAERRHLSKIEHSVFGVAIILSR